MHGDIEITSHWFFVIDYTNNRTISHGLCQFGGGGGSSGKVGFATYLENAHIEWLGSTGDTAQVPTESIVDVMEGLFSTDNPDTTPNPYTGASAYDPAGPQPDIGGFIGELLTHVRKVTSSDGYLNSNATHTSRQLTALSEWDAIIHSVRGAIDNPGISKAAENITTLVSTIITQGIAKATAAALQSVTDSKTNIDTIVDGAIVKALAVINSQSVKDSISVFSESLDEEVNLTKARFSAGMAEANATMSSAFIFGNSNIENSKIKAIERFTTDLINKLYSQVIMSYISSAVNLTTLETQTFNNLFNANLRGQLPFTLQARQVRDGRLDANIQLVSSMLFANISNELMVPQMYRQALGTIMVAMGERDKEDVRLSAEEKMWDLKVYNAGVGVLGGLNAGGGTLIPEGTSQIASAISGGLSGAMLGAGIGGLKGAEGGAVFGPWGAAIGAGIGGLLGAFGGFNA